MRHKGWIAGFVVLASVVAAWAQDVSLPQAVSPTPIDGGAVEPPATDAVTAPVESTPTEATPTPEALNDELAVAILRDDDSAVRRLLAAGASASATGEDGSYPIHLASQHASIPVMKLLIAQQPDLLVKDSKGRAAMHYAAMSGDAEKVRLLATFEAPVDEGDADGVTPLYHAYIKGDLKTVDLLLELGARINRNDNAGEPMSFRVIAVGDREEVVRHMIDKNLALFRPNLNGQKLVTVAEAAGYEKTAKLLQEKMDAMIKAVQDKQNKVQGTTQGTTNE